MICLYGIEIERLRAKDPFVYRMLWLFRMRAADRQSWITTRGISAALSEQDPNYYAHVTETEAQAVLAHDVARSSRKS